MNNNFSPKPLPDELIDLYKIDKLGTKIYVELLVNIIENCKTPYTIGIFGSWGSGKSSIIKTLQEKFSKGIRDKRVFIYDAWKYSKDDFRRTFILELREFFKLDTTQEKELFYADKIQDIKYTPKFDKGSFFIFIICLVLIFSSYYFFFGKKDWGSFLGSILSSGLITFILSWLRQIFIYHKISITTSKIFAPEQFLERFKNTIKEIEERDKLKKIIIAVDNIDRCPKEQALEILQTIKTFLEIKGVVFIIPVDDNGLRKFLQMSNEDANEFLRKIFNSHIQIKHFTENSLYDFALDLVNKFEINLPHKETLLSMICQEFSKNPRRIIQFINTLQNEYYIAVMQEKEGLVPKGSLTNNIEMLAKLLILRENYPDFYLKLYDNKSLLSEINFAIKENRISRDDKRGGNFIYRSQSGIEVEMSEILYRFLIRTSNIDIEPEKLEIFFIAKDVFVDIPDEVYNHVINQNWEKLKELIDKEEINLFNLLKFINDIVDEEIIKRKLFKTTGFNIASLIFKIVKDHKEIINNLNQYPNIQSMFAQERCWEDMTKFSLDEMLNFLKLTFENKFRDPLSFVIRRINNTPVEEFSRRDDLIKILNQLILYFKNEDEVLHKIKNKFSELLKMDFNLKNKFDNSVFEKEVITKLLDNDFVEAVLPTLNQDFNQNMTKEKVEIIRILNEANVLTISTKNNCINKYIQFIPTVSSHPYYHGVPQINFSLFSFWCGAIEKLITRDVDRNTLINLFNILNSNYFNYVWTLYTQMNLQNEHLQLYKVFLSLCGKLYIALSSDSQRQPIISGWLFNFISNPIHDEIFSHANQILQEIIKQTDIWYFAENIIQRFSQETDKKRKSIIAKTLNLMVKYSERNKGLNEAQISKIVISYFKELLADNKEVEKWLLEIYKKTSYEIIKKIIDLEPDELVKCKVLIEKIGLSKLYEKIKALLASDDVEERRIGIELLDILKDQVESLEPNKKETLLSLLSDIDINNFPEKIKDDYEKLKRLLKELSRKEKI